MMETTETIIEALKGNMMKDSPDCMMSPECLEDFGLGSVDCPHCGNTGMVNEIVTLPSGYRDIVSHECECMKLRRSYRTMRQAGLDGLINTCTLDRYTTEDARAKSVKDAAQRFIDAKEGWFFIGGQVGSGKTHICTAVCWELVNRGNELIYFLWRDKANSLKAGRNEREWFEKEIQKYQRIPLLYLDDFWKGTITEADINLAFEIINARYNNPQLRTVISSELPIEKILSIDEAVGSRIVERARGFVCLAPDENYRLRKK